MANVAAGKEAHRNFSTTPMKLAIKKTEVELVSQSFELIWQKSVLETVYFADIPRP